MNVIQAQLLRKEFKVKQKNAAKVAVDDISFCVEEGESLAFIGPNGAGKSTTIKMLTGILFPSAGSIDVLGLNPTKDRIKLSYNIGTVFGQKEQLWVHLSAYSNFLFFGSIYDIKRKELQKRIEELAETFALKEFLHQPVKSLSLGQRMKCEMAASLLHKPKLLFFDEPTIGLDPIAKETLRNLITKTNKELGTTIFFTSHDVGDIEEVCKRVIIINEGKIVLDNSMKNLKYRYLNKKMVEVKFSKEMPITQTHGLKILKNNGTAYQIEVDLTKTSIDEMLTAIKSNYLVDVSISSTPLEDIIKDIYRSK